MIFCPPVGFNRASTQSGWVGGKSQGSLSVDACAAACRHAPGCAAFTVSDASGCTTYVGKLQPDAGHPHANTSAYLRVGAAESDPLLTSFSLVKKIISQDRLGTNIG